MPKCVFLMCVCLIGVPEKMKSTQITKRQLIHIKLELDNIKEAMGYLACNTKMTPRASMHMLAVNKTRLDH